MTKFLRSTFVFGVYNLKPARFGLGGFGGVWFFVTLFLDIMAKEVKIITEQSNEVIDFVQFVEEVLSYDMFEKGKSDGLVVPEVPQSKPVDLEGGK